jgi:hypothetical protein
VLFANIVPMIGILMIPKTLCYVWIVILSFCYYLTEYKNFKVSAKEKNQKESKCREVGDEMNSVNKNVDHIS